MVLVENNVMCLTSRSSSFAFAHLDAAKRRPLFKHSFPRFARARIPAVSGDCLSPSRSLAGEPGSQDGPPPAGAGCLPTGLGAQINCMDTM